MVKKKSRKIICLLSALLLALSFVLLYGLTYVTSREGVGIDKSTNISVSADRTAFGAGKYKLTIKASLTDMYLQVPNYEFEGRYGSIESLNNLKIVILIFTTSQNDAIADKYLTYTPKVLSWSYSDVTITGGYIRKLITVRFNDFDFELSKPEYDYYSSNNIRMFNIMDSLTQELPSNPLYVNMHSGNALMKTVPTGILDGRWTAQTDIIFELKKTDPLQFNEFGVTFDFTTTFESVPPLALRTDKGRKVTCNPETGQLYDSAGIPVFDDGGCPVIRNNYGEFVSLDNVIYKPDTNGYLKSKTGRTVRSTPIAKEQLYIVMLDKIEVPVTRVWVSDLPEWMDNTGIIYGHYEYFTLTGKKVDPDNYMWGTFLEYIAYGSYILCPTFSLYLYTIAQIYETYFFAKEHTTVGEFLTSDQTLSDELKIDGENVYTNLGFKVCVLYSGQLVDSADRPLVGKNARPIYFDFEFGRPVNNNRGLLGVTVVGGKIVLAEEDGTLIRQLPVDADYWLVEVPVVDSEEITILFPVMYKATGAYSYVWLDLNGDIVDPSEMYEPCRASEYEDIRWGDGDPDNNPDLPDNAFDDLKNKIEKDSKIIGDFVKDNWAILLALLVAVIIIIIVLVTVGPQAFVIVGHLIKIVVNTVIVLPIKSISNAIKNRKK